MCDKNVIQVLSQFYIQLYIVKYFVVINICPNFVSKSSLCHVIAVIKLFHNVDNVLHLMTTVIVNVISSIIVHYKTV